MERNMIANKVSKALQCWPETYKSNYEVWHDGKEEVTQPVTWWQWNKGEVSNFSRYRVDVENIIRDYIYEQTQSQ
jgi:hypothetical protein